MTNTLRRWLIAGLVTLGAAGPVFAQDDGGPKDPPISAEKLNDYIKGFNFLVGTFGLEQQYQQYTGQQIDRKTVRDPVFVSVGWVDQALDELQQARRVQDGGLPELDQAGDRIIPVLDRLVRRIKGLDSYYESRGQTEDNFARGKQENPLVIADFKEALADMQPLNAALDDAIAKRDAAELAQLKASGDMVGYDSGLALQKSKALVDLFNTPQDVRDPAKIQRGDALVEAILAALSDERTALAAAKTSGDDSHSMRNSGAGSAAERLMGLVGAYRDMKHSGNALGRQMMLSAYNDAVEQMNIMQ